MKFCIICSHPYDEKTESKLKEYEDTCISCRKILLEEAPGVPLVSSSHEYHIEGMLEDLERRIPGLFFGTECPLEFSNGIGCSCTYESGCKALKKKDKEVDPLDFAVSIDDVKKELDKEASLCYIEEMESKE